MIYRLDKCILTDVVCGYQQMKNCSPAQNTPLTQNFSVWFTVKTGLKCIHVFWSLLV